MRSVATNGVLLLTLSLLAPASSGAEPPQPSRLRPELWLYYATNLQVAENVDKLEPIWRRAAQAGYTHVLLADSKFARLGDVIPQYFQNAERVKRLAKELDLTVVPAVFHVGYSNSMLYHDPNLAEGFPVKDAPFLVKGGEARLDPAADGPPPPLERVAYKDKTVTIDGNAATVKGQGQNHRFNFRLKLKPHRSYHISVKIRTENFSAYPEVKALPADSERSLQWQSLVAYPSMDWAEQHVAFNTLEHSDVTLYFGVWATDPKGTLQWKDWKIEEVGLVNVLRRPGTPLVVKGEDGTVYEEGRDFEPVTDPRMGNQPYNGEYKAWHEPPAIRVKPGGRIREGARLRVSWHHPAIIYGGQVGACVAEPKTVQLLADEARRVRELWNAPGYMMSHDEVRTLGFDESCRKTGKTPGQLLADNVRQCRNLLKPATAYAWNDMFDPHHNAVEGPYYLVNGPLSGSWEGLDTDVVVMNWNYGKRDQSLKFFADRGHRQIIAGYYDGGMDTKQWVESAAKVKGVVGFMYTTWHNKYDELEAFAKTVQDGAKR